MFLDEIPIDFATYFVKNIISPERILLVTGRCSHTLFQKLCISGTTSIAVVNTV